MIDRVQSPPVSPQPDVSYIVGAYNVAPYIEAAVRSALAEIGVEVEVIVTDDASTDDTAAIVSALAAEDPRIVLHRRVRNGGLSAARNDAMALARGRWLAILDGDDVVSPARSRHLIDLADTCFADIAADNYERVTEDGSPTGSTMFPAGSASSAFLVDLAAFIEGNITFRKSSRTFGAMKQIYRHDFVRAHGLRYREEPKLRNEDFLFCAEALMAGARLVVSSESHYRYRQRQSSISYRVTAAQFDAMVRANADLGMAGYVTRAALADGERARLASAVARYDRALVAGARYVALVEEIKRGGWSIAASEALANPALWPLLTRMGGEAVMHRLRRLMPRPAW